MLEVPRATFVSHHDALAIWCCAIPAAAVRRRLIVAAVALLRLRVLLLLLLSFILSVCYFYPFRWSISCAERLCCFAFRPLCRCAECLPMREVFGVLAMWPVHLNVGVSHERNKGALGNSVPPLPLPLHYAISISAIMSHLLGCRAYGIWALCIFHTLQRQTAAQGARAQATSLRRRTSLPYSTGRWCCFCVASPLLRWCELPAPQPAPNALFPPRKHGPVKPLRA
ncbi:hypothetical protein TRVL_09757 [Trypanosoma vivax]|nr:hypothetical protein TRVL_09757 [Trypanosoma vivax]